MAQKGGSDSLPLLSQSTTPTCRELHLKPDHLIYSIYMIYSHTDSHKATAQLLHHLKDTQTLLFPARTFKASSTWSLQNFLISETML